MNLDKPKSEEKRELALRIVRLRKYQLFHMYFLVLGIAVSLFAENDAVTYGFWTICVAVFAWDRLTAREIGKLQRQVDAMRLDD